jgi:hypothetical protein
MDVIESGNIAAGNTIQNVSNFSGHLADRFPDCQQTSGAFARFQSSHSRIRSMARPRIRAAGLMTGSVAAGFGGGFAIDLPLIGTLIGTLVGADWPPPS